MAVGLVEALQVTLANTCPIMLQAHSAHRGNLDPNHIRAFHVLLLQMYFATAWPCCQLQPQRTAMHRHSCASAASCAWMLPACGCWKQLLSAAGSVPHCSRSTGDCGHVQQFRFEMQPSAAAAALWYTNNLAV